MAMQTVTMSAVKPSQPAERNGFIRKLVLLFLLDCAAALGLAVLFRAGLGLPDIALVVLADAALGLLAGVSARLVLRKWNGFFRFVVSLATLLLSLNILGFFTGWRLGLGFNFNPTEVDWLGLAQVGIGVLAISLSMLVLRRAAPKPAPAPAKKPTGSNPSRPVFKMPKLPQFKMPSLPKLPKLSWPVKSPSKRDAGLKVWAAAQVKKPRKKVSAAAFAPTRLLAKPSALIIEKPARKPKKNRTRGRSEIQLAKVEEHVCPFCLEPVIANDPRGMVECKVCHTQHHGDCWEITGACQVPHYNA
jgi:ribosomal protein L37AE/L43A